MGKLLNGINGPFSGKVGSVIGFVVNGRGYIKGHYKARTKNISDKELLNREKFAAAQAWLTPLTNVLRAGFKNYRPTYQGFAAAKSYLMKNALSVEGNEVKIDPSKMMVAVGSMSHPKEVNFAVEDNKIRFTWDTARTLDQDTTDQALILAYDPKLPMCYGEIYGPPRKAGEYILEFNEQYLPKNPLHLYFAFFSADRITWSDSIYLGKAEF